MDTLTFPTGTPRLAGHTSRFTMAMLVWLKPTGAARMTAFRERARPLFAKYDLRVERQLMISGKGQIVGENRFEQPDIIQILSFPSMETFKAYAGDADYLALARDRDKGIRRLDVMGGMSLELGDLATPGAGPIHTRLYGVGLVRFIEGGEAGMDAFNVQAQKLFARHGMHLEAAIKVGQVRTPIGVSEGMDPHRVVTFFLDDAAALKAYAADPESARLATLHDDGLERYDLFLGMVPRPADAEEH